MGDLDYGLIATLGAHQQVRVDERPHDIAFALVEFGQQPNATATAPEARAAATWESPHRVMSAEAASATPALSGSRPGSGGCHSSATVSSTGPAATTSALALAPGVSSVVLDRLVSVWF